MKLKLIRSLLAVVFLGLLLTYSACDSNEPEICNPGFDLDQFELNVLDKLDGKVKGYGYIILIDGLLERSGVGGLGRNATDGAINMTLDQRMHIASVSKFITTVATLHVLELKGLTVHTKIKDYLPTDWSQGTGIDNISFLDLIAQQAGLTTVGSQNYNATHYDSLKRYIGDGATNPKVKRYTNTHHALLRIILPILWDKYRPVTGGYDAEFCANIYEQCIQELLFDKISITANCQVPAGSPNLCYSSAGDNAPGAGGGLDYKLVAGGFGWNMSVTQVAAFWAYSWYTNDYIDDDSRLIMTTNTAGLWNTLNGSHGTYYNKLGQWTFTNSRQFNAIAMHYPNDVDLIVITNSVHGDGLGLVTLGKETYDEAFGCF